MMMIMWNAYDDDDDDNDDDVDGSGGGGDDDDDRSAKTCVPTFVIIRYILKAEQIFFNGVG